MARLKTASSARIRRLVTVALVMIFLVPTATVIGIEVLARAGRDEIGRNVEAAARAAAQVSSDEERDAIARRESVHLWVIGRETGTVSLDRDHAPKRRSDLRMPSLGAPWDQSFEIERRRPSPGAREHVVIAREDPAGWSSGCATYFDDQLLLCEAAARTPQGDVVLAQRSAPRVASRLVDARPGLLLVGGVVLLLGVVFAAWLVRRLTRPLAVLEQQVTARARGERATIALDDAPREIATVASTVDVLASRLEANSERQARAAADLAHELKSPLARIRIALDATELDLDARRALEGHARSAVTEIDAVIADLLEIARAEAGLREDERTPCALHELVAGMLEDRRPPDGIAVRVTGAAVAPVTGPALSRAIGHLLDNAYVHARSEVMVTIEADARSATLTVADDGPGVAPELLPRLFERFATRRSGGTGLGLAYVRAIARAHRGEVTLVQAPGSTRFVVTIPRVHIAFTNV